MNRPFSNDHDYAHRNVQALLPLFSILIGDIQPDSKHCSGIPNSFYIKELYRLPASPKVGIHLLGGGGSRAAKVTVHDQSQCCNKKITTKKSI